MYDSLDQRAAGTFSLAIFGRAKGASQAPFVAKDGSPVVPFRCKILENLSFFFFFRLSKGYFPPHIIHIPLLDEDPGSLP